MLWVDLMIIPASVSWMKCLSARVDLITSFSLDKAFTFIDKKIMSLKCPHLRWEKNKPVILEEA